MRSHLAPFLVGLTILAACAGQPMPDAEKAAAAASAVDLDAARAAIAAANKAWDDNYVKANAQGVAATFTDDAARHPAGQPTTNGRAAIETAVKAEFDSVTYSASSDSTDELIVAGDYLIEIGSWSSKGTAKSGKPRNEQGRYMAVWKRDATGAWKIYRDIGNNTPTKP